MAGKFPLAFSNVATYGSVTNNANPYYYIHNVSNLSIFANADFDFDVESTFNSTLDFNDSLRNGYSIKF